MQIIKSIIVEIWLLSKEMAFFLILGFIIAGILSQILSKKTIYKHLGGSIYLGSIKAALIGIPMPICSCGVIPIATSLKKEGASSSATISFITSTPQTGIDSLMITYALLGPIFTIFRALMAFISGIICGITVGIVDKKNTVINSIKIDQKTSNNIVYRMLYYGFVELPKAIAKPLLVGLIISGIINTFVPENAFSKYINIPLVSMFIILIVSIPLYVCSSASVPLALSFLKIGFSPGAVLIFLIMGPATNITTITTIWKIVGKKQTIVFLITLCICAFVSGIIINNFSFSNIIQESISCYSTCNNIMDTIAVIILYIILTIAIMQKKIQTGR